MFVFTPYLGSLLSGPDAPKAGSKDFLFKTTLNGLVNEAFTAGRYTFTEDEIVALVTEANAAAGQDEGLVSLKMSYARKENWFMEVK
jgi:hypothetical protein